MKPGDLMFKAAHTRWDSWRTVQEYEVYHHTDKTKILAFVTNKAKERPFNDFAVVIPGLENITYSFQSTDEVVEFLIEHYEEL